MSYACRMMVATLVTAAPLVTTAQVLQPPLSFDCDVPPGRISTWEGRLVGRSFSVSGTIEFQESREHERYLPVASVLLSDGSSERDIGLQFAIFRDEAGKVHAFVRNPANKAERTKLALFPWEGTSLKFTLVLTSAGDVTLTVGDASAKFVAAGSTPDRLHLSCSTAEVEFKDVVISANGDT